MNVWTRDSRAGQHTMADDSQDTVLPLGNASVVLQPGDEKRRFRVHAAIRTPRGKHRVRLTFEGPQGSVVIDLPRVIFWSLTSRFHEQSAAADLGGPAQPAQHPRRKRP